MTQHNKISDSARAAKKAAARKHTAELIASGQKTPLEAQIEAAPYTGLPVQVIGLKAAVARYAKGSDKRKR